MGQHDWEQVSRTKPLRLTRRGSLVACLELCAAVDLKQRLNWSSVNAALEGHFN